MFPEQGEEIACDCGNFSAVNPGNYLWAYIFVKYLRDYIKKKKVFDQNPFQKKNNVVYFLKNI